MVDLSRRGFLRGRLRPGAQIRPPWALPENEFAERCTRCNDCLRACPQGILVVGDGGYPTVDFSRAECTFCAACLAACQPGALLRGSENAAPWPYTAQVSAACLPKKGVECRICGDFCDLGAIRFPPRAGGNPLPEIDPGICTGCGACVAPCPATAISIR